MCGIFGVVNRKIEYGLAEKCLNTMFHRGPDAGRIVRNYAESCPNSAVENYVFNYTGETRFPDRSMPPVTFGHRRLAIMDLSDAGVQPMSYANGKYLMVFNGEIYNFLEIRSELTKKGYTFTSDSDSEVVLAAYMEWQEDCVEKFNGMWSLAIWDNEKQELFMSRDRFGVKPLYYIFMNAKTGELIKNPAMTGKNNSTPVFSNSRICVAFASEMKALLPLMSDVTANKGIVGDRNRIVYYESTEECVVEGIHRLQAGYNAKLTFTQMVNHATFITYRYWNTLDHLIDLPSRYEDQVEMCREIFLDACKLRMRSDVTIGTALSGGLDSSATICAMAHLAGADADERMNKDWQHAFVASFPGTTLDETQYAKQVTDFLGIGSTFVNIDPISAIDKLSEYVYMQEDVYLTSPIPMMLLYGAIRKEGTIVTIDGHGADEIFGGYTFDFVNSLADAKTREEKDMVLTAYIESFPKDGSNMAMKSPTAMGVRRDMLIRKLYDIKNYKTQGYKKVRAAKEAEYKKMDTLGKRLYASTHETILPTLLRNYDRYSMANSVEIRMPFMDYRMVTFGMSLPWQSRLHGGFSKAVIRDAMAPFMPQDIAYRRTKIGFNSPIVEWMKGPLKEYFTDILDSWSFSSCDLINPGQVRADIEAVINDENATFAMGENAFSGLYPYLWEQAFLKQRY